MTILSPIRVDAIEAYWLAKAQTNAQAWAEPWSIDKKTRAVNDIGLLIETVRALRQKVD